MWHWHFHKISYLKTLKSKLKNQKQFFNIFFFRVNKPISSSLPVSSPTLASVFSFFLFWSPLSLKHPAQPSHPTPSRSPTSLTIRFFPISSLPSLTNPYSQTSLSSSPYYPTTTDPFLDLPINGFGIP